jgi:hypothetical protein
MSNIFVEPVFDAASLWDPFKPLGINSFGIGLRDRTEMVNMINNRYEEVLEKNPDKKEVLDNAKKFAFEILFTVSSPPPPYVVEIKNPNFKSTDPFEILGLSRFELTRDILDKQFRNLARQYHPDRLHNKDNKKEAARLFKIINGAKTDILTQYFHVQPTRDKEDEVSDAWRYMPTQQQPAQPTRSPFYNAEVGDVFTNITLQPKYNLSNAEKQSARYFVIHKKAIHDSNGSTIFARAYEWDPIKSRPIYSQTPYTILDETYQNYNINARRTSSRETHEPTYYSAPSDYLRRGVSNTMDWFGYGVKKTRHTKTRHRPFKKRRTLKKSHVRNKR